MLLIRRILALAATLASAFAAALEVLGTLPAPTLPLLAIAVLVPELAAWAAPVCAALALAVAACARGRLRAVGLACAGLALALALVPLAQYPATRAAAERGVRDALGATATATVEPTAAPDARVRVLANVPVRAGDGTRLALDVYRVRTDGPRPTLVTIYGGAWRFGRRADTARLDRDYAARGYTVVAIDYRHVPGHRFPTQLDDVRAALAAVATHARAWNVDVDRVALLGRSAGAELALLGAYERSALHVRAAIGYYAPTDLAAGYRDPPRPDPADVRAILRAYIGGTPLTHPRAYRDASPVSAVRAGLPATLLVIGLRDALVRVEQQRALRDALRARGDAVVAIELPWSNHVFDAVPGGLGERLARDVTERFLAATLRPRRATISARTGDSRSRDVRPPLAGRDDRAVPRHGAPGSGGGPAARMRPGHHPRGPVTRIGRTPLGESPEDAAFHEREIERVAQGFAVDGGFGRAGQREEVRRRRDEAHTVV